MRRGTAITLGGALGAFAAVTGLDFFVDVADGIARLRRRWRKR